MIEYEQKLFGFQDLTRIHGSALYKAVLPAAVSTLFLTLLDLFTPASDTIATMLMWHPYAVGALIVFYSFLLTFRLNFAYSRYWEGATTVHNMISKWLDAATMLASFHYQSSRFDGIRPSCFGNNPQVEHVEIRGRERTFELAYDSYLDTWKQQSVSSRRLSSAANEDDGDGNRSLSFGRHVVWTFYPPALWGKKKRGGGSSRRGSHRTHNRSRSAGAARGVRTLRDDQDLNTLYREKGKRIGKTPQEERQEDEAFWFGTGSEGGTARIPIPLRFQQKFVRAASLPNLGQYTSDGGAGEGGDGTTRGSEDISASVRSYPGTITGDDVDEDRQDSMQEDNEQDKEKEKTTSKNLSSAPSRGLLQRQPSPPPPQLERLPPEFKVPEPSLFLEEMAHLMSLLSALALATLRNDNPCAEVPITEYVPGQPWPPVDPDKLTRTVQHEYGQDQTFRRWAYYVLGITRTEKQRTLYNSARPFAVLGGVSDREVRLLQDANGPLAKVMLGKMWVEEFFTREYLAGSTGKVAPPIISRLYQLLSDGLLGFNQARKIAYIPFPYPHSQCSSFFSMILIFTFPVLYITFVEKCVNAIRIAPWASFSSFANASPDQFPFSTFLQCCPDVYIELRHGALLLGASRSRERAREPVLECAQ